MTQIREMQNYIARLEQENHAKDQAIDKAAKVIESMRNDLERTRNELNKCEQQLSKVSKVKPINEREKNYQMQFEDINQQCQNLKQQLMEVTDQYRAKERAFQNALISIEQKESLIEDLQARLERLNTECDVEKENAQKEIDFVKRITENFHRSNPMDISAIVKRRTGHSPDSSFILADQSNIIHNRNRSRQSRKPTMKMRSSETLDEVVVDQTPHYALKYINFATNDFDWEQTLYFLAQSRKTDLLKLLDKAAKRDYMQDIRCQIEQWQMRCSELEMRFHQATERAVTLSELLHQSQFQFEYLKRSSNGVFGCAIQCLRKMLETSDTTCSEMSFLVEEVEGSLLPEVSGYGEFALQQFQELISSVRSVIQNKNDLQTLREQNMQRKMYENQTLEGQLGLLKSQLTMYKDLYYELIDKLVKPNEEYTSDNLQRFHRQARQQLDKLDVVALDLIDRTDQLQIQTEKLRLTDLELREAQHQNSILHQQLVKEEKELRFMQGKFDEINKQIKVNEEENIQLREELLDSRQFKEIYSLLQSDFAQLTDDHKQTMNLLDNALQELEQLQQENEKLCEQIDSIPQGENTEQSQRILSLTALLEDKNQIIQSYQQRFSKKSLDYNQDADIDRIFRKLKRTLEQCIVSSFQYQQIDVDYLDMPKGIKTAVEGFLDALNQVLYITQTIIMQDISFISVFEDQFDLNLKQQMRDMTTGKDGLDGFVRSMATVKQEIIQSLMAQQSSIRYQESINNQSDVTMKLRSNRVSTLSVHERVSVISNIENDENKFSDISQENSYRQRQGGRIQRTFKSIAQQYTSLLNHLSSQWIEQAGSCDKSLVLRLENIVHYCKDAAQSHLGPLAKKSINCLLINSFLLITLVRQWKEGTKGIAEIFFEVSTNFSDLVQQPNTTNKDQLSKMQMKYELFQNRVEEIISNINNNSLAITVENHLKQLESSAEDILHLCEST